MRRLLNCIYVGSGWIAAVFLALTCGVVLLQVGFNLVGATLEWTLGIRVHLLVPSYAEFAGYFFAAMAFFGLGYTHHSKGHIRVSLLLDRIQNRTRMVLEFWCVAIAALISGFFTVHAFGLAISSFDYGDVSVGLVAVRLWIPQAAMACGLLVVTIAVLDDLARILLGRRFASPAHGSDEGGAQSPGSGKPAWVANDPLVNPLVHSEPNRLRPEAI